MAQMRQLAAEKSAAHRRQFVGSEIDALTLHTPAPVAAAGRTHALTENFLPVELNGSLGANQPVRVLVTGVTIEGALVGRALHSNSLPAAFAAD
jgi:hypothetical protein